MADAWEEKSGLSVTKAPAGSFGGELGWTGLRAYGGYISDEEFIPELRGERGRRVYRQMESNDPVVGAILFALSLLLRSCQWSAVPADESAEAQEQADFAETLFDDMSHTFEDFVSEVLSMLVYGWAYHEMVLKLRVGPDEDDPSRRSKYTDGLVGIRKMPLRPQDSLARWEIDADGGISGMWQAGTAGQPIFIPIDRSLLFRTTSRKNSPEGVSVLRTAYRPWYFQSKVQEYEAVDIERELAGLPIVRIPSAHMLSTATAEEKAVYTEAQRLARDLRMNHHAGVVMPSDTWVSTDGTISQALKMDVELLSSSGNRSIDTNSVIKRYETNIARSVLADFIMLGSDKGSFALSKNKTDLFLKAAETFNNVIASVLNRFCLPRVFALNGVSRDLVPEMRPGNIAPEDIAELGTFIQQVSSAGGELFPDDQLENHLRDAAGLPEKSEEAIQQQEQRRADLREATAAARAALAAGEQGGADEDE